MTTEARVEWAILLFMVAGIIYIHFTFMRGIRKEGLRKIEEYKEVERKKKESQNHLEQADGEEHLNVTKP